MDLWKTVFIYNPSGFSRFHVGLEVPRAFFHPTSGAHPTSRPQPSAAPGLRTTQVCLGYLLEQSVTWLEPESDDDLHSPKASVPPAEEEEQPREPGGRTDTCCRTQTLPGGAGRCCELLGPQTEMV